MPPSKLRLLPIAVIALLWTFAAGAARAQTPPVPLEGYAKAVSGQTIVYRSYVPAVSTALLAYTSNGTSAIDWQTAAVPAGYSGTASFRWVAGYALGTAKGAHRFQLAIDGNPVLAFTAVHDPTVRDWSVTGTNGVVLRFHTRWDDRNGDRMGDMTLTVPAALYRAGSPLDLRVTGEPAGVLDWYMTFEYAPAEWADAIAQPALVACKSGACQVVELRVLHVGADAPLRAETPDGQKTDAIVRDGYQIVDFPVAQVAAPATVPVTLKIGDDFQRQFAVTLAPVVPRTFYVLHHSHMDVGFSTTQAGALAQQMKNVRDALALIQATRSYPDAARFRWNIESLWGAQAFLKIAAPAERAAFIAAVRNGSIGLSANYANELTGLESAGELLHLTDYAHAFERHYGVRLDTAFFSDVPNYSWSIVPALAENGVRYFSSGPNYYDALPDRGDRVGSTYANGDAPFWWTSQSGANRLLFWMAGHGYSSFNTANLATGYEPRSERLVSLRTAILRYANELQERHYPYGMVQLRYSLEDNGPVDSQLSDFVRSWNAHFIQPKLSIATAPDLMHRFEARYGGAIPVRSGDLTPYWEDGAASSAAEEAIARRSSARLEQAATLTAMLDAAGYDRHAYDAAWSDLLMWNEHTWGARTSASDPDGPMERSEWSVKRDYALRADAESSALFAAALGPRPESSRYTVYNTSSWPRSGLVVLDVKPSAGDTVVDEHGDAVPSQRLSNGQLAFWAAGVAAFGSAGFEVKPTLWNPEGEARAFGTELRAGDLTVEVDPNSGAISSLRFRGHEFADRSTLAGLNAYLYVPGRDPQQAVSTGSARVTIVESGPLVAALAITSGAPGAQGLVREIRVVAGSDRVEIVDRIDKSKVRDFESVHIAFPFAVPAATTRIDLGFGALVPGINQLPGSNADFYTVRQWLDVSNASEGISLATPDAPLVEIGSMVDERPSAAGYRTWKPNGASSPLVYSYAMNNYWRTNYRADQEGPVTFRYVLAPHEGTFDALAAARFGDEIAEPLVAAAARPHDAASLPFAIAGDASLAGVSRDAGGREIVRLYNPQAQPIGVDVRWKNGTVQHAAMPPYGLVTLVQPQ